MLRDTTSTQYYENALQFARQVVPTGKHAMEDSYGLLTKVFDAYFAVGRGAGRKKEFQTDEGAYNFLMSLGFGDNYIIEKILGTFSEEYTLTWDPVRRQFNITELD